ncbi:MAG: tetratricopeptide repeat protein [Planctomycetaceae bacterium]
MRRSHGPRRGGAAPVVGAGGASLWIQLWLQLGGGLLIALAAVAAFWPSLRGEFLWDDDTWIAAAPTTPTHRLIHDADGLRGIWLTNQTQDYWPLSNSAFWLEWRLWGMNPTGYRAVNLLLHALGAVLVWRVGRALGIPWAWLGALLFAVHPVTVASVAWIAELKNCLSLPLCAAALLCWLRFDATGRWAWYAVSLVAFLLALTAKTSTVILPPLLLACGWWRRGRIGRQDILRAAPFFLLALAMGLVTLWRQATGAGVPGDAAADSLLSRVAASGWVAWFYLGKALLPFRLAMLYPRWTVDPTTVVAWLPLAGLVAMAAIIARLDARWRRPLAMGLGCYLLALGPVLGIVPMWFRRYSLVSDHLQYLALPSVTMLVAAGLRTAAAIAGWRPVATGTAAVLVLGCMALTWERSQAFTSTVNLMEDSLATNPDSWTAHTNLGAALGGLGRSQEAIGHYEQAIRLRPTSFQARNNLATMLLQSDRPGEAIPHYQEALRINPDVAEIHSNLGVALALLGNPREASDHFREVVRLMPTSAEAHNNLGYLLAVQGRLAEAVPHYEEALRLNPAHAKARDNLRRAREELGRQQSDGPGRGLESGPEQP